MMPYQHKHLGNQLGVCSCLFLLSHSALLHGLYGDLVEGNGLRKECRSIRCWVRWFFLNGDVFTVEKLGKVVTLSSRGSRSVDQATNSMISCSSLWMACRARRYSLVHSEHKIFWCSAETWSESVPLDTLQACSCIGPCWNPHEGRPCDMNETSEYLNALQGILTISNPERI